MFYAEIDWEKVGKVGVAITEDTFVALIVTSLDAVLVYHAIGSIWKQ